MSDERKEGHSQLMLTKTGIQVRDPHPPAPTVFDEARATIAQWEKDQPDATRIALVMDTEKDVFMDHTGKIVKMSDLAGLFFTAAHMVLE